MEQSVQTHTPNPASLLFKHLTPELEAQLASVVTPSGFTLADVIRSGVENPDSSVGVYAGDQESYDQFGPFLNKVIYDYHRYDASGVHKRDLDTRNLDVQNLDPSGERILSTRIRVGRNLADFPFGPSISREQRQEVARQIVDALSTLTGDIAGEYYPLAGMDEETRVRLVNDHFLFKKGDRFLESAGVNRDWPEARGIFHSADKRFLVWVNEEDELRIISMQQGADLREVFDRLSRAISTLEKKLKFAYSDHLGYLSSCPTNLGTAMRASFHMRLPLLSQDSNFKQICTELKLSVRGIHGEHSDSEGGIFDISNKQRLGISEVQAVHILYHGASMLLSMEKELEKERA